MPAGPDRPPMAIRIAVAIGPLVETGQEAAQLLSGTMARIMISLYQILRPLGSVFDITYPQMYRTLLVRIGFMELDFISINVTPLGCMMDLTFHHTLCAPPERALFFPD
jgi:hypothetical protein